MAQFNAAQRRDLAASGAAMKDGSYPIRNATDLRNAVSDYDRAGQKPAVKAHIIQRAKELGLAARLPEAWRVPDGNGDADDQPAKAGAKGYDQIIAAAAAKTTKGK